MWNCLKDIIPKSAPILPHAIHVNGIEVVDDVDIAEAFNDFFITNASNITKDIPKPKYSQKDNEMENDIDHPKVSLKLITPEFVINEIDRMCADKATGEDGISCKMLKLSKEVIAQSVTDIINKSFVSGTVPRAWKRARVVPIFKSGDIASLNNYRPISVLPIISKIIERAVHKQLSEFLETNNLLHPNQSGFRPKHSTNTLLMKLVNQWSFNIEKKRLNGVAFIDLRKAFDTVDHELLLSKLRAIGCVDELIEWFKSYLSDREQVTSFQNKKSHPQIIKMGVPQGSILGPLLFSIYVNDLPKCTLNGTIDMYADDTTLSVSGSDVHEVEQKLTSALDDVMNWISRNRLVLNTEKTCVMTIGSRANIRQAQSFNVNIRGTVLKRVQVTKCLGVLIDEELNWSKHVDKITKTLQRNISVIKRAKTYLPQRSLSLLYNCLVLPHFDYCSTVWSNRYQFQTNKLKKVQKRAARIITNKPFETPSIELFQSLNWMPLENRFEFNRVTTIFKCLHNLTPNYLCECLKYPSEVHDHFTRKTNNGELYMPKFITDCYKYSPIVSAIRSWNNQDTVTREARTIYSLKLSFRKYSTI